MTKSILDAIEAAEHINCVLHLNSDTVDNVIILSKKDVVALKDVARAAQNLSRPDHFEFYSVFSQHSKRWDDMEKALKKLEAE